MTRIWRAIAAGLGFALSLASTAHAESRLTVAVEVLPRSNNPFSSTSIVDLGYWSAFYDPLTLVTTDGELLPWLAVSWRQTSPTRWQFTLRENVRFSNGTVFNAAAVVAALDYLKSERGKIEPVARDLANITTARVISEHVVEFDTTKPDPLLPRRLSILRAIEPNLWAQKGPEGYAASPIGTGPYKIETARGDRVKLVANTQSWRKAPTDTLNYIISTDATARLSALQIGDVDAALNALSPDEFDALKDAGGSVFVDRIPAVVALILNTVKETPFRDERVRKAMILAVNRHQIVAELLAGQTVVADQPATRGMIGFSPNLDSTPYDPAKAKALLTQAGYPNGFAFDMEMPASKVLYISVFQAIAADLRKVGITMTVRQLPQIAFQEKTQLGNWAGPAFAWPFFSPTSDPLYAMQYHSCGWAAAWYCDQTTTDLINKASAEPNLDARKALTTQIMTRAHDTAQALFLYESVSFIGLGARVQKFRADYGFIRFEDIALKR
ncbi:MAG: ABC transporter substrate-binding protein [Rhodospirillaceae bacterium]|nr:ABC transporter substrate-binding protein [Rhodospirillaceae bacterium]